MTLRCFISHPWASNLHYFALKLVEALRSRSISAWIDQEEMLPGQGISARQKNGIVNETNIFILVLAPATLKSKNCMEELRCALEHQKRVIVLQVEPCEMPEALRDTISVDFLNPVLFDAAVERLVKGLSEYGRLQGVIAKINSEDADERIQAIRILADLADVSAFATVKRRIAVELDDTVVQWIPGYLASVARLDLAIEPDAMGLLKHLAQSDGPLTRRSACQALQEYAGSIKYQKI